MCINSASGTPGVYHYYNTGYVSALLDSARAKLGLSSASVAVANSVFTCSFTRANSDANSKYFNVNTNSPYLISAYGRVNSAASNKLMCKFLNTIT
jgi:hypothetical protein